MKDSFLLPFTLGIRFIAFAVMIALLIFLYSYVIEFSPSAAVNEHWIISRILSACINALLPAALITIIYGYFYIVKHPGTMVVSFMVFFLCVLGMFTLTRAGDKALTSFSHAPSQAVLHERTIQNYSGDVLYITATKGNNVTSAVHLDTTSPPPRINAFHSGYLVTETGMLRLEDTTIVLEPLNPGISSMMEIPVFASKVIRDILLFKKIVQDSSKYIFLFSLYFCSLWIFSRISTWPLFNMILIISIIRGTLFFLYSLTTPLVQRILTAWNISSDTVLTTVLAGISLLLVVWDLFFVPYPKHRHRKDVSP
ncbi:MAG: hypothetical protein JXB03_12575 [Spirochaetales bacterium]|nr:hypothetical protein [Spirochaetales bacterium]